MSTNSIPISVYPRTAWGRPINEAYWFSFVCGLSFCFSFGGLVFVALTRGFKRELNSFLQYGTHFSAAFSIAMSFANQLDPYGCGPHPFTAYTFSFAEIACDAYILMIVWALVGPGKYQKPIRNTWLAFFFIAEIASRIAQYAFITYVPVLVLCQTVVNPTVSTISTILKTAFIISMGVSMTYTILRAKSEVVSSVGLKSVVACIFLIIAKLALFVPFSTMNSCRYGYIGYLLCDFHYCSNGCSIGYFGPLVGLETQERIPKDECFQGKPNTVREHDF
jgi:hypothetical protein